MKYSEWLKVKILGRYGRLIISTHGIHYNEGGGFDRPCFVFLLPFWFFYEFSFRHKGGRLCPTLDIGLFGPHWKPVCSFEIQKFDARGMRIK